MLRPMLEDCSAFQHTALQKPIEYIDYQDFEDTQSDHFSGAQMRQSNY